MITKTEIDNAPEWATHWSMTRDGKIMYESKRFWQTEEVKKARNHKGVSHNAMPIPRKEFDIMAWHNQRKDIIKPCIEINGGNEISVDGEIDKEYSIAFAKYFKLTAEDLK